MTSTFQVASVAAVRPTTGTCAHAIDAMPAIIATPVAGTTMQFASTAYGATSPNVAALSGHTPICVATVSDSASFTLSGSRRRARARSSGRAKRPIAATHENDSANDTVVTDAGHSAATTSAASASAFHDRR